MCNALNTTECLSRIHKKQELNGYAGVINRLLNLFKKGVTATMTIFFLVAAISNCGRV